jgi:hypothetical protein
MTSKIHLASQQLNKFLTNHISTVNIDDSSNRLKLVIDKGIQIYIRYNNHGEYTYEY